MGPSRNVNKTSSNTFLSVSFSFIDWNYFFLTKYAGNTTIFCSNMFWWVTLWLFANSVNITQMTNIFIDSLLSSWFSEHKNWEYYRIIIPMKAVVANCKLHCHLHFHLKLSVGDWEVHNEFIICTWTDVLLAFQFQISSALNIEHYTSTHTRPGVRPGLNKGPGSVTTN